MGRRKLRRARPLGRDRMGCPAVHVTCPRTAGGRVAWASAQAGLDSDDAALEAAPIGGGDARIGGAAVAEGQTVREAALLHRSMRHRDYR